MACLQFTNSIDKSITYMEKVRRQSRPLRQTRPIALYSAMLPLTTATQQEVRDTSDSTLWPTIPIGGRGGSGLVFVFFRCGHMLTDG